MATKNLTQSWNFERKFCSIIHIIATSIFDMHLLGYNDIPLWQTHNNRSHGYVVVCQFLMQPIGTWSFYFYPPTFPWLQQHITHVAPIQIVHSRTITISLTWKSSKRQRVRDVEDKWYPFKPLCCFVVWVNHKDVQLMIKVNHKGASSMICSLLPCVSQFTKQHEIQYEIYTQNTKSYDLILRRGYH